MYMLSTDTWISHSMCHCAISAWMHLCTSVVSNTKPRHSMCYCTLRMHRYLVHIIIIGDTGKSHSLLYMCLFIHGLKMETPFEVHLFFKIPPEERKPWWVSSWLLLGVTHEERAGLEPAGLWLSPSKSETVKTSRLPWKSSVRPWIQR